MLADCARLTTLLLCSSAETTRPIVLEFVKSFGNRDVVYNLNARQLM
jgi:hypothetical protein